MVLAAVVLAGCSADAGDPPAGGSSAAPSSAPAAVSPEPVSTATCTDVEFGGERLGVTVPAGSTVDTAAAEAGGQQVSLLARIQQPGSGRPDAVVAVFGHETAGLPSAAALEASVLATTALTGAERPARLAVAPSTIDGRPAQAGGSGGTDPSALRWWTLTSGDVGFVVVMSALSRAVGTAYGDQIVNGVRAGGC